ncbi:MAG: flagellar hook-length control protein FliK [Syntrophomonadales bacterium]
MTGLLLPFTGGPPGTMGAVTAGKPGKSDEVVKPGQSNQGFDSTLRAANRAIGMASQKQSKPQDKIPMDQEEESIKGSQDDAASKYITENMPSVGISVEKLPVRAGPILENAMMMASRELLPVNGLRLDSAPSATTPLFSSNGLTQGLLINHASPRNQVGSVPGMFIEKPSDDTKLAMLAGSDALRYYGEYTGDKVPTSNNMYSSPKQELPKNQAQRMELTTAAKAGEDSELFRNLENRTITAPKADTGQLNKVGKSETVNPANLITTESEKLQGVKTQATSGSEGMMETPQVQPGPSRAETVMAEKTEILQKPVSTEDIIDQIVKKIEFFPGQKSSAVIIKLEPEFLGKLQINLEVVDDVLVAKFSTDNQQVKQLLEMGIGQLRNQLETTGIRLERAEVNIDLGQHQGEYQHHNQPGYQKHQPLPYEFSYDYPAQYMSETGLSEMGENQALPGDYSEGSVNYLI